MTAVAAVEREPFTMAISVPVLPAKLEEILADVEDILLDHNDDPFLLTGGERNLLVVAEQVLTTAVEDGKGFVMGWEVFDLLTSHTDLRPADFVGGTAPTSPALDKWAKRNSESCTEDFDGICRCNFKR